MNIGEVYSYVGFKLGKDQFGQYMSPSEFNELLPIVNIDLLNEFIAQFEATNTIMSDVEPFVKTMGDDNTPALAISAYGYGELPEDYIQYTGVMAWTFENISCHVNRMNWKMVEMLSRDRFNYRMSLKGNMRISPVYPVGCIQNQKLYVAPAGITEVQFTYFRKPVTPFFGYTIVNGEPIYDPNTSVQLEWPEQVHEKFCEWLIKYYSINFRSEMNYKTAETQVPN